MTKKEILKNFPIPTKFGVFEKCAYVDLCTNILPGLNKPNKCGGRDVMNNEKMGNLISFAYESPLCDTPVDALYDAYTWLIKNGKIELDA